MLKVIPAELVHRFGLAGQQSGRHLVVLKGENHVATLEKERKWRTSADENNNNNHSSPVETGAIQKNKQSEVRTRGQTCGLTDWRETQRHTNAKLYTRAKMCT